MNIITDIQLLASLNASQRGVYAKFDLQTAFAEPHPTAFNRRLRSLIEHGVLRRFCRGWYISQDFDLATLSQRIAPVSYVSFGTVLARELLTGTNPVRQITAVKSGTPRRYTADGYVIDHVSTTDELLFGFTTENGVRYANAEKAVLDTLYYHLRGRRYAFDIYSDLSFASINRTRLREYLSRYKNPKFIAFVEGMLKAR